MNEDDEDGLDYKKQILINKLFLEVEEKLLKKIHKSRYKSLDAIK